MLILCEKPSVTKDFASALGASAKNGNFEGGGYTITYCVGHLFELCQPESYNVKYKKWNLEDLPIIPEVFLYAAIPSVSAQAAILRVCL